MGEPKKIKCFVNYTTFARDLEWLRYSLESFRKYATGFAGVTIVVPVWDVDKFLQFERYSTPECPVLIKNFLEYPGKGFVHHLAMKCYADVFSPDANFILHMDPDCLFSAPVTPQDYIHNKVMTTGLTPDDEDFEGIWTPDLVIEPYEHLKTAHPPRYAWKAVTEAALKFECTHEAMCRHPAVHHKATYLGLRDHMESVHLTPFMDFVLKQKNSYPQGFGEFNTIGAYAMARMPCHYNFIDRGASGELNDPKPLVKQLWSYTGVHSPENMAEIQRILG